MEQMTIKEIAKLCGVGVSTVSRAINNHPDINEETRTKVLETIQKHNYIPNNSARNLKRSVSSTIAVLAKGINYPFYGNMIQVFEREIAGEKYTFILQHVEENEDEVETAIHLEKEKRLKGIVFLGGLFDHSAGQMKRLTVPFVAVTVDRMLPDDMISAGTVSINNEEESRRMVEYLIGKGHRRIAILSAAEDDTSIGRSRLDGYRKALDAHGIICDPSLICCSRAEKDTYTIRNGYEITRELLRAKKNFTCIYAISDTLAIGACKAVFDEGLRVPEDISVAGFDGLDIARYYHPSITTVCQPREEMAEAAVKMLFDLIWQNDTKRTRIFMAELLEGQSVRTLC